MSCLWFWEKKRCVPLCSLDCGNLRLAQDVRSLSPLNPQQPPEQVLLASAERRSLDCRLSHARILRGAQWLDMDPQFLLVTTDQTNTYMQVSLCYFFKYIRLLKYSIQNANLDWDVGSQWWPEILLRVSESGLYETSLDPLTKHTKQRNTLTERHCCLGVPCKHEAGVACTGSCVVNCHCHAGKYRENVTLISWLFLSRRAMAWQCNFPILLGTIFSCCSGLVLLTPLHNMPVDWRRHSCTAPSKTLFLLDPQLILNHHGHL